MRTSIPAKASIVLSRTGWLLRRWGQKLWVRATLFSVFAVLTAFLAAYVGPYLPDALTLKLAAGSVDDILHILTSSMLSVAIFSLSIMVAAYSAATNNTTPRSIKLLIRDPVAQNALATFVGVFLFGIVAIIGLAAGVYDDKGRILLFGATLLVVAVIAGTLLRWIGQLSDFGRVGDIISRVEEAATQSADNWARLPRLGAMATTSIPSQAWTLTGERTGYLQHVDMKRLNGLARQNDLAVHVCTLPGAFVHPARVLARVAGNTSDDIRSGVESCFTIGRNRQYDQDPRFGLIVLSEIASRALSPGINDPGTAIEVIGAGTRVLMRYAEACDQKDAPCFDRVFAEDLSTADFFDDFFNPIARDGAALIEVQMRLQAILEALVLAKPQPYHDAGRRHAVFARERALDALKHEHDRLLLRDRSAWATCP